MVKTLGYELYAFVVGLITWPVLQYIVYPILEKKIHDRFEVKVKRKNKRKAKDVKEE